MAGSRPRPSLRGVSGMPARERAYRELKFRILEGSLPPGTSLLEAEAATMLSLSRTPIREALIRLQEEGLVEVRPRHGVTVRSQSVDDLAEIYEVFSVLEVQAARLLARRGLSASQARQLDGLLTRMERATAEGDVRHWSHLDDIFHADVVGFCGNSRLQATLRIYWDQQYRARMAIVPLRPPPHQSDLEHRAIMAALLAGDEAEAGRLYALHRDRTDRQALDLLRRRQAEEAAGGG